MPKMKNWGGSRPGAGRPLTGKGKRQITTIALEPALIAALERYAKQAGLSRNEAVNRLLSSCLLSDRPESVQKPLIDTPGDELAQAMAAVDADPELTPRPALPLCLADVLELSPVMFGQWFTEALAKMIPPPLEQQDQFKDHWPAADPNVLNGFRQYGPELIDAIKAGKIRMIPAQAKGLSNADESERRKALITFAGIEL